MTSFRRALPDFQLANPIYVGAQVFVYTVNEQGDSTGQYATLYAGPRGTQTLPNPLTLDGDGKFDRVPYIEQAVIQVVVSATVGSHQTGIVHPGGTWRGQWAPGVFYGVGDFIKNGSEDFPTIYGASADYTSRATIAEDIDAGDLVLILNAGLLDAIKQAVDSDRNEIAAFKDTVVTKAGEVATQHTTSTTKFNEYRNSYYGPYAAPPTTRPDGSAIEDGDTFLRTTAPQGLHYRLGGSWVIPSTDTITLNNKLDKSHEGAGGAVHAAATQSAAGFMSAADKAKLDTVAQNANNFTYTHPTGDGNRHLPSVALADVNRVLKAPATQGGAPFWAALGKADVGLSQVDNTSDANKPISNVTAQELAQKYDKRETITPIASPIGIAHPAYMALGMEVKSAGGGSAAAITLHRVGSFGCYFGLDSDNQLAYGGWSMGATRRVLWDTNNFNPAAKADLNGSSLQAFYTSNLHINGQGWITDLLNGKASLNGNTGHNFYANDFYLAAGHANWLSTLISQRPVTSQVALGDGRVRLYWDNVGRAHISVDGVYQGPVTLGDHPTGFVQNVRLGGAVSGPNAPAGHCITSVGGNIDGNGNFNPSGTAKPIQRQINGAWATISG